VFPCSGFATSGEVIVRNTKPAGRGAVGSGDEAVSNLSDDIAARSIAWAARGNDLDRALAVHGHRLVSTPRLA
jgi:hypothetical protein